MGWRKGKALGLKEDGCKEHVKVSTKSDRKGLQSLSVAEICTQYVYMYNTLVTRTTGNTTVLLFFNLF